jgi:hypothetical protein
MFCWHVDTSGVMADMVRRNIYDEPAPYDAKVPVLLPSPGTLTID